MNIGDDTAKILGESVDWDYFNKFNDITDKYMPDKGEGDTKASQIVTAINKLVYKWYNDGDVYDNNYGMSGWANDLSSYANWLLEYADAIMLKDIYDIGSSEDKYETLLRKLADTYLNEETLKEYANVSTTGTIYSCDGPFKFTEEQEDDEWEDYLVDDEEDEDEWEEEDDYNYDEEDY